MLLSGPFRQLRDMHLECAQIGLGLEHLVRSWGFEGFKGESTTERAVGAEAKTACFGCHAPQKARDYVFSSFER